MNAFLGWVLEHGSDSVTAIAIIIVVKVFIGVLNKQYLAYREMVSNHIDHSTEAAHDQAEALVELTKVMHEMLGTMRNRTNR